MKRRLLNRFEFNVPIIVRTAKELQVSIERNPFFSQSNIEQLHLTFLKEKPCNADAEKIFTYNYSPDKFKIEDKDVFIFCAGKYHQSKLTNNFFEKKLNTEATTRNWKTVLKLLELSKG